MQDNTINKLIDRLTQSIERNNYLLNTFQLKMIVAKEYPYLHLVDDFSNILNLQSVTMTLIGYILVNDKSNKIRSSIKDQKTNWHPKWMTEVYNDTLANYELDNNNFIEKFNDVLLSHRDHLQKDISLYRQGEEYLNVLSSMESHYVKDNIVEQYKTRFIKYLRTTDKLNVGESIREVLIRINNMDGIALHKEFIAYKDTDSILTLQGVCTELGFKTLQLYHTSLLKSTIDEMLESNIITAKNLESIKLSFSPLVVNNSLVDVHGFAVNTFTLEMDVSFLTLEQTMHGFMKEAINSLAK